MLFASRPDSFYTVQHDITCSAWLNNTHRKLDAVVWPLDLSDDDLLTRLLALNRERAAATRVAKKV